ncbi:MAG: alpha/beta fold hydrolase [Faecousia sp.]
MNRLLIRALAGIGNWNIQKYIALMAKEAKADAEVFLQIPETKAMFEESFQVGIQQGGEGMIETLEAVWDWDFDPAGIHIPAVVFYGGKDDMIDNQMTIGLARQLPDSRVKAWKNVSHYGFVKRECWVDFISSCSEKSNGF